MKSAAYYGLRRLRKFFNHERKEFSWFSILFFANSNNSWENILYEEMKSNMKWDQLDFEQLKNENVWKILRTLKAERSRKKSFFIEAVESLEKERKNPCRFPWQVL